MNKGFAVEATARWKPSRKTPLHLTGDSPIYTTLFNEGRVVNLQCAFLPLQLLKEWMYYLRRNREELGERINIIDCMAATRTSADLEKAMRRELAARYGEDALLRYFHNAPQDRIESLVVDVPESGCSLGIIPSMQFFNGQKEDELWFLDWSDFINTHDPRHPCEITRPERHLVVTNFHGFSA